MGERFLALLLLALSACTCNDLAGPGAQLTRAAKGFETLPALPGDGLQIHKLRVSRITPEPELAPPRVTFSFDLDGAVGPVQVGALGVERVPMVSDPDGWRPLGSPLPRLSQTLARLEPDLSADAGAPVAELLIRVDVEQVAVTEVRRDGTRQARTLRPAADGGLQLAP